MAAGLNKLKEHIYGQLVEVITTGVIAEGDMRANVVLSGFFDDEDYENIYLLNDDGELSNIINKAQMIAIAVVKPEDVFDSFPKKQDMN